MVCILISHFRVGDRETEVDALIINNDFIDFSSGYRRYCYFRPSYHGPQDSANHRLRVTDLGSEMK
jgi:hypothetical protein